MVENKEKAEGMGKIWGHFKTITEHRRQVIKNCYKSGILLQGLKHDLSKYSPTEFWVGTKFYTGRRSPNEGEREAYGFSEAWMHHKGRNKHHFEYWTDYNPSSKKMEAVKMPMRYVIEMFCDRVAASKTYLKSHYHNGAPLDYFLKGKASDRMHPETSAILEKLLRMLADEGEEKTFVYIRKLRRKGRNYT